MPRIGYSIVVADDNRDTVQAVSDQLNRIAHQFGDTLTIFPAYDGSDVLTILRNHKIDVLFLDYYFDSGMNADEILHRIEDRLDNQLIILMSAKDDETLRDMIIEGHKKLGERFKLLSKTFDDREVLDKYLEIGNYFSEEERMLSKGEDERLEFKATLRWNIAINPADKGIEHSALKSIVAFLNTEGGTLLVGIQDDGKVLGIQADNFPNEDKYLLHFASLLNDRIGKHYVGQIQWRLKDIRGKKILRVDCQPSLAPVFLKNSEGEDFYVRNGPSSVSLSTRRS